jgi:hypothetical protein
MTALKIYGIIKYRKLPETLDMQMIHRFRNIADMKAITQLFQKLKSGDSFTVSVIEAYLQLVRCIQDFRAAKSLCYRQLV